MSHSSNDSCATWAECSGSSSHSSAKWSTLRRETSTDRFGKRIYLNREVQIGDAAFDDAIYIETDAPDDVVRELLAAPAAREGTLRLLALECTAIELDTNGDVAVELPARDADAIDTPTVLALLDALAAFAESFPPLVVKGRRRLTFADWIPILAIMGPTSGSACLRVRFDNSSESPAPVAE